MYNNNEKNLNRKVYLAGPDVFRKKTDMIKVANKLRNICNKYDLIGHFPIEEDVASIKIVDKKDIFSLEIYFQNIKLLTECDIIVANLEPFRGPHIDDGTAYEIGYGRALGKLIYGYSSTADKPLHKIHKAWSGQLYSGYAEKYKKQFPVVEKFGKNSVNLMIQHGIETSGGKIFQTFDECISDLVNKYLPIETLLDSMP